jgi:hypothetical protein
VGDGGINRRERGGDELTAENAEDAERNADLTTENTEHTEGTQRGGERKRVHGETTS